jgi:tetratricopeptide (TPR) repeat protein
MTLQAKLETEACCANRRSVMAFKEALKLEPKQPAARFFSGLAYKQEGKTREALQTWKALLDDSPADAPWRAGLEREIADLSGVKAPVLSDEQVAAAGTYECARSPDHDPFDGRRPRSAPAKQRR